MHIKKERAPQTRIRPDTGWAQIYPTEYNYTVFWRGFITKGPDLGACIAACHGAANETK